MSTEHPRSIKIPLPILRQQLEDIDYELRSTLNTKLDPVIHDLESLDAIEWKLEKQKTEYLGVNKQLSIRLLAVGCIDEATRTDGLYSFFMTECMKMTKLINDTRSVLNGSKSVRSTHRSSSSRASKVSHLADMVTRDRELEQLENIDLEKSMIEAEKLKLEADNNVRQKMIAVKEKQLERVKQREILRASIRDGTSLNSSRCDLESTTSYSVQKFVDENDPTICSPERNAHLPVSENLYSIYKSMNDPLLPQDCSSNVAFPNVKPLSVTAPSFVPSYISDTVPLANRRTQISYSHSIPEKIPLNVCSKVNYNHNFQLPVHSHLPKQSIVQSDRFSVPIPNPRPGTDYPSVPPISLLENLPTPISHGTSKPQMVGSDVKSMYEILIEPSNDSRIDAGTFHLVKTELFRKSANPFSGEPHKFWSWVYSLRNKIAGLGLRSHDILTILETHTIDKPNKLVRDYLAISGHNTDEALFKTCKTIQNRYGSAQLVANELSTLIQRFGTINSMHNYEQLQEFLDLCQKIQFNITQSNELCEYNQVGGQRKLWLKLPEPLQNKWRSFGNNFELQNNGQYPQFHVFISFFEEKIQELCNVNYHKFDTVNERRNQRVYHASDVSVNVETSKCILHSEADHLTRHCRAFEKLSYDEKLDLVKFRRLCYNCLANHRRVNCKEQLECEICKGKHCTAMHRSYQNLDKPVQTSHTVLHGDRTGSREVGNSARMHAGDPNKEVVVKSNYTSSFSSNVTHTEGTNEGSADCAHALVAHSRCDTGQCSESGFSKILLVELLHDQSGKALRCYCLIDEQSSSSFIDGSVLNEMNLTGYECDYTVSTLVGNKSLVHGQIISGFSVRGLTMSKWHSLPSLYTSEFIPDAINEVATPEVVSRFEHIEKYSHNFLNVDPEAHVLLLLGRNSGDLMATRCYGSAAPFVHRTALGWALVSGGCPGLKPHSDDVSVMRTSIAGNDHWSANQTFIEALENDVFRRSEDDEMPGPSKNDTRFFDIIDNGISKKNSGNLQTPLPLTDRNFPDNKETIFRQMTNTLNRLKRNKSKLDECLGFMQNNIDAGHVEMIPRTDIEVPPGKRWFIHVFPVVHRKKGKIRLVFNSSASFHGVSLNSRLYQGPDQNNRLHGVILRFREGKYGFVADIEKMYHCFFVDEQDQDYMRFFWFEGNDPNKHLVQYRAKVHIFGNVCSPAIAIYALRYASLNSGLESPAAKKYINDNFYMDDGLGTADSTEHCIQILTEAKDILKCYNINLHKIVASSPKIIAAFPEKDRAVDIQQLEFTDVSLQRALGIAWDIQTDHFLVVIDIPSRPFTKRGILSTICSLFDPLGFVSPIIIAARIFQRIILPPKSKLTSELESCGWDDPLPSRYEKQWVTWKVSLVGLRDLKFPRSFYPLNFGEVLYQTMHVFSDASEDAIGYAVYIRSVDVAGTVSVTLVCANAKVSPRSATTIPRLELCAAVEGVTRSRSVLKELTKPISSVLFYTDSKVVLGYLKNQSERFSKYVTRRVELILRNSLVENWRYIDTNRNPADLCTRPTTPSQLLSSNWISGPRFLQLDTISAAEQPELINDLPETVHLATVSRTNVAEVSDDISDTILTRNSSWDLSIRVAKFIINSIHVLVDALRSKSCKSYSNRSCISYEDAKNFLLLGAQRKSYGKFLIGSIQQKEGSGHFPGTNHLAGLAPFVDAVGLIRVGGRLKNADVPFDERFPVLLPAKHPISTLVIRHFHEKTRHQGRHLTLGAIRSAGYHIEKSSKAIKNFIGNCVVCRKLRIPLLQQKMADLPAERLQQSPPFTYTALDVFGHFLVHDGTVATRRTKCTKKLWALLLTCMVSRAVHIEPLPSLDTSSMRNALQRFMAIRGVTKYFRSDQGSNFIAVRNQLNTVMMSNQMQENLRSWNCEWQLNPPGASHFGGVHERKIGAVRQVLNATLLLTGKRPISRDEMHTFLVEATSVVNNTPLYGVSTNPNDASPISPASLLTLRDDPNPAPPENFGSVDALSYGANRWRRVQHLVDQFWIRWRKFVMQEYQSRHKWKSTKPCVCVDDCVLVRDKNKKRNEWPVGRVVVVKPSTDGLVRSVIVKIDRTLYERAITDLVMLIPSLSHDC